MSPHDPLGGGVGTRPRLGGRGGWKGGFSLRGLDVGRFFAKTFRNFFHQTDPPFDALIRKMQFSLFLVLAPPPSPMPTICPERKRPQAKSQGTVTSRKAVPRDPCRTCPQRVRRAQRAPQILWPCASVPPPPPRPKRTVESPRDDGGPDGGRDRAMAHARPTGKAGPWAVGAP